MILNTSFQHPNTLERFQIWITGAPFAPRTGGTVASWEETAAPPVLGPGAQDGDGGVLSSHTLPW